jgi:hypothetical protein
MMNIYEVTTTYNLQVMSPKEQDEAVSRLLSVIYTLQNVKLLIMKKDMEIKFVNSVYSFPLKRVYLYTDEELAVEETQGYKFTKVSQEPLVYLLGDMYKESTDHIKLLNYHKKKITVDVDKGLITIGEEVLQEEPKTVTNTKKGKPVPTTTSSAVGKVVSTKYARLLHCIRLPHSLPVASIIRLLDEADAVIITLKKVPEDQALSMVQRLSSLITATGFRSYSVKAMKLNALFDALLKQQTALFKCSITAIITANTLKELKLKEKKFKKVASLSLMKFEPLPYMQNLKEGRKEFYLELGSLAITYPFVASELIEDDGILLGLDTTTYAPVIWNYKQRDNYNMVILASSGAGKSVTAKTIANRLLQKNKDTALFIIDPQGEYERLSQLYNATVIRLAEPIPLGLDPFRLFDKRIATNVIADVLNAPETVRKEILAVGLDPSTSISSINDLYEMVGEESKKYLLDLVKDPRMQPSTTAYGNRIIFSLKGTYGGSKTMEAFLLTLALAKIWNLIYNLPLQTPKVLLIDEGWMLFNIETTAKFVNLIARTGRKLNVILMFLTQKPEDVITNEHGRALLDNAETKILLRNDHTASSKIKDALQLSQQEEDILPMLQKGECLLIVKRTKLKVRITPSREELELFATTPFYL